MSKAGDSKAKEEEKKQAKKLRRRKINIKDRANDIPNCPSLESVEYYNSFGPDGATADLSEFTLSEDVEATDPEKIRKIKEELMEKVAKRQREKDLEELYGLIDGSSSEEEEANERAKDIKALNEPYNYFKQSSSYDRRRYESSERYRDPEWEAAERERAERRRQQTQEFIDNLIWASLSVGKQSAFLFAKMVNYSAKYPTPASIALIVIGLYMSIMYLELSAAAFAEWCIQWFWPTTRIFLRGSERFLKKMSAFLNEIDDLGQSTYCDMADLWCTEFGLMCNRKCSFLDMALDRARY